jgi:transglutaminase-like putative cysteine protease
VSAAPDTRLRTRRDLASLLQIAIATVAVALGGGIDLARLALFAALVAWAFVRDLPPAASRTSARVWTLGIAAALVATIARVLLRGELLDAGVDFLLLLAVQRFFNRQRSREHLQLLLLGALLMVVGAVVNTDVAYPAFFVAYLFAAVWALMLTSLVGEGERLGPRVMLEVGREALARQRSLLRAAAGVTALAALGALVVFLFFPRWGVGAFLRGALAGEAQSGFGGEVSLGDFGRIKSDPTVVMRIRIADDDGTEDRPTWHLRGSSFDRYEGGRWSHSRAGEASDLRMVWAYATLAPEGVPLLARAAPGDDELVHPRPVPGFSGSTELLTGTVTLEDIGADVIFAPSEPLGIKLLPRGPIEDRARLNAGKNRELRITKPPGPIRYEFLSRARSPTRAELSAVGHPSVPPLLSAFAEPVAELSPEVGRLADTLAGDAGSRLQAVEAVMRHLGGFRYTLDLSDEPTRAEDVDPVEWFLFDTQAGHCEYYATALVVLLRELHVPARIVNGYYGAHRNEIGGFYAVRQADAHSWVEVHFGPLGWVTFDPTPPGGRTAGDDAPWWPAGAQLLDAMRNAYLQYVIDYDLGKQMQLLESVGLRRGSGELVSRGRIVAASVGALAAVAFVLVRILRRKRTGVRPETRLMLAVLRRLARRGHRAADDESMLRFAARLRASDVPWADAFHELATAYEAARFGRPGGDLGELHRLARRVRHALEGPG